MRRKHIVFIVGISVSHSASANLLLNLLFFSDSLLKLLALSFFSLNYNTILAQYNFRKMDGNKSIEMMDGHEGKENGMHDIDCQSGKEWMRGESSI